MRFLFLVTLLLGCSIAYCAIGDIITTIDSPAPGNNRRFGDVIASDGNYIVIRNNEPFISPNAQGKLYSYDASAGEVKTTHSLPSSYSYTFGGSNAIGNTLSIHDELIVFDYIDKSAIRRSGLFDVYTSTPILLNDPDPNNTGRYESSVLMEDAGFIALGAPRDTLGGQVHLFSLVTGAYSGTIFNPQFANGGQFGHYMEYQNGRLIIADESRINVFDSSGNLLYFIQKTNDNYFGLGKIAVSGDTLCVINEYDYTFDRMPISIYSLDSTKATLLKTIYNSFVAWGESSNSMSLSVIGDIIALGEYSADVNGITNSGRIHFHSIQSGSRIKYVDNPMIAINPQWAQGSQFGCRITPVGDNFLVGMPDWIGAYNTTDVGRCYLLEGASQSSVTDWNQY